MRKLALSDEILMGLDKAARYIGGEVNSVMKTEMVQNSPRDSYIRFIIYK